MSILPGIYASQITGHLSTNSYESIATVTAGSGGFATATFSSIPQTYKHLQIRYIAYKYDAGGNTTDNINMVLNGDTGSNYTYHVLYGNGTSALATAATGQQRARVGQIAYDSTGIFAAGVIDILDYTNTNKNTTIRTLSGVDFNGSGPIALESSVWLSTAAVSSILINNPGTQYTQYALYGIRG